ncbi:hypothetical protein KIN20_008179 [Parelaphostrongylus tenuis]|uniref:ABTB2/3 histone-like domain-containing protein n=1 Tax=Parelaphostrongylus tenuis TaxID=148309 RepID=A0AAD5MQS8_PARTN|nr:hypothetical protein KIN20_008179 [Parelaphostrongylus tenuis]
MEPCLTLRAVHQLVQPRSVSLSFQANLMPIDYLRWDGRLGESTEQDQTVDRQMIDHNGVIAADDVVYIASPNLSQLSTHFDEIKRRRHSAMMRLCPLKSPSPVLLRRARREHHGLYKSVPNVNAIDEKEYRVERKGCCGIADEVDAESSRNRSPTDSGYRSTPREPGVENFCSYDDVTPNRKRQKILFPSKVSLPCIKAANHATALFYDGGPDALEKSMSQRASLHLSVGRMFHWLTNKLLGKAFSESNHKQMTGVSREWFCTLIDVLYSFSNAIAYLLGYLDKPSSYAMLNDG